MCEKYRINIKNGDRNIEIEGFNRDWVEGNTKQFLDKLNNSNLPSAKNKYVLAGVIWVVICLILAFFNREIIKEIFSDATTTIKWCSMWSSLGIAACLFNNRKEKDRDPIHFFIYYPFIFVMIVLSSLSLYYYALSKNILLAYFSSASVALILGFISNKLYDVTLGYFNK
jgi:hypothetical protein